VIYRPFLNGAFDPAMFNCQRQTMNKPYLAIISGVNYTPKVGSPPHKTGVTGIIQTHLGEK
jgi:hypothetical protein